MSELSFPTQVFRGVSARPQTVPDFSDDEEETARMDGLDPDVQAFNGAHAPADLLAQGLTDPTGKTAPNYADWLREKESRRLARERVNVVAPLPDSLMVLWDAIYGQGETS